MTQIKLEEFESLPSEMLDTISESEFFNQLEGSENERKDTPPNPAPKTDPNPFEGAPGPGQGINVNASQIVSGELATELLNRILPVLLSIGVERFLNIKAPKKQFELTAAEKSTISPLLDGCLQKLNINFENPFVALGLSLSFIYGSKVIDVANNPEFAKEVSKAKTKVSNAALDANGKPLTRKPGETRGRKPGTKYPRKSTTLKFD